MALKWHSAKVVAIEELTPSTRKFILRCDSDTVSQFKPGQFITLDLPIHEKRTKRWRSYSIANLPSPIESTLELCIVYLEDGLASEYLFQKIKIGDEIPFKGPAGTFVYPEGNRRRMVMICTGTGIAPFRSMLLHLAQYNDWPHGVHLIFGTRTEEGILYREEMETLAIENDHFSYDVVLSRQKDWSGYQGYVHQIYENQYKEVTKDVVFYLCGWSSMVDEARSRLVDNLGYSTEQVRFELYG